MEKVRSKDRTTIAFDRLGSGKPVVLVSGASTSRTVHQELAEAMARHFTVINYDRRGRGDSGDTVPYAVKREIEDLQAVIGEVGGWAAVFGNSSGAVLVLRAAAAGLPIEGLALWEPPFMTDPDARHRAHEYASKLAQLLSEDRRGDAMALFMSNVGVPEAMIAGMRSSPAWGGMEALAPTLAYDDAVMADSMVPADVAAIKVRTLVLTGEKTGAWADSAASVLMAKIPKSEHRVLAGQTHAVAWDVLARELIPFFSGV